VFSNQTKVNGYILKLPIVPNWYYQLFHDCGSNFIKNYERSLKNMCFSWDAQIILNSGDDPMIKPNFVVLYGIFVPYKILTVLSFLVIP